MVEIHVIANQVDSADIDESVVDQDKLAVEAAPSPGRKDSDARSKDLPADARPRPSLLQCLQALSTAKPIDDQQD